jgi:hypothetical protein
MATTIWLRGFVFPIDVPFFTAGADDSFAQPAAADTIKQTTTKTSGLERAARFTE